MKLGGDGSLACRWQRSTKARQLVALALFGVGCAGHPTTVVRVVDGVPMDGRFVSHVSYAAYARAAQLEANEDLVGAEAAYQDALRYDPQSPQIWTRLGGVRCLRRPKDASAAFETALRIDPEYAPLWYERARCSLEQGNPDAALEAVERAMELDPEHIATSELMAEVLLTLKRPEDAERYLAALTARYPELGLERAYRHTPSTEAAQYTLKLAAALRNQVSTVRALDRALLAGDLKAARHYGLELDLSSSEIAVRAVMLGRSAVALEQAREVLAADPNNAAAWVTQLVASDLAGNQEAFQSLIARPPESPEPLGPGARLLFAELLKRRIGIDAARAFLVASETRAPDPQGPDDALLDAHQERLDQELSER